MDSGRRLLRQSPTARPEYEASDDRQNNSDHDHRVDVDRQPEDLDLDVLADLDLGLSNQCQPGHRATLCRVDQTNETGTFMSNTRAMPMAKPPSEAPISRYAAIASTAIRTKRLAAP